MKKILFTLLGISGLLLHACTQQQEVQPPARSDQSLRLSVAVQELSGDAPVATRVASEEGEDQISTLHLLFFAPSENGSGQFIDYLTVPMPEEGYMPMNIDREITLSGSLSATGAYNILAIANASDNFYLNGSLSSWMSSWTGKTEKEVMFGASGELPAGMSADGLLMNGRAQKKAGESRIHIELKRSVVRFDVYNNVKAQYDLLAVTIWNAFTTTSIWGEGVIDYSAASPRERRYYAVDNEENIEGGLYNDIKGGLYAMENQVASPQANDDLTTCLIVKLRNRSTNTIGYYRANMLSGYAKQMLVRNHAYRLTINGVSGDGGRTEEEAYLNDHNRLLYTINDWNLGPNELITQDANSIMQIPTKTASFGRDGGSVDLSIYTMSSLPNPAALTVRSETYEPAGSPIHAEFRGNMLHIVADPLGQLETERRGVIVITYAGLENSINVVQSGQHDDLLEVILPEGGIPRFPTFGGSPSGLITVRASDAWTATLYMDGFTFNPSVVMAPMTVLRSGDASGLVTTETVAGLYESKFRVYTHAPNPDLEVRQAFIMVTLDKDPVNYASVIRLTQEKSDRVNLVPADQPSTTFTGAGDRMTLANNENVFTVLTGVNEATGEVIPWNAEIIISGAYDDRARFNVATTPHLTNPSQNQVTVTATGLNASSRDYEATLRISTDANTYTDVVLYQRQVTFQLLPAKLDSVSNKGGEWSRTATVTVDLPSTLKYRIVSVDMTSGTAVRTEVAGTPRTLIRHQAKLFLVDTANGNTETEWTPASASTTHYPTTRFYLEFPKVYYPNREIFNITATVTIALATDDGAERLLTLPVHQKPLTSPGIRLYEGYYGYYGSLGSTTSQNGTTFNIAGVDFYAYLMRLRGLTHWNSTVYIGGNLNSANYVHQTNNGGTTLAAWSGTKTHMDLYDDLAFFCFPYTTTTYITGANALLQSLHADYTMVATNAVYDGAVNTDVSVVGSRIYKLLISEGPYPAKRITDPIPNFTGENPGTTTSGAGQSALSTWPAGGSAIPILVANRTTGTMSQNGYPMLLIDPVRQFIYLGEPNFFDQTANSYQLALLDNLISYVSNAARYGSHFTDLLLDTSAAPPAPWDDYWNTSDQVGGTDNRWVEK